MLESRGLNSTQLKWIAIVTMVIDHAAMTFCPEASQWYLVLRGIGRLAFPIYCFLVAEGYAHTRDWRRYLMNLVIFGLISELPFNLLASGTWFHSEAQNVMFTLALGLAGIGLGEQLRMEGKDTLRVLVYFGVCLAGWLLRTDYGLEGAALILAFWLCRGGMQWWLWPAVLIFAMGGMEVFALAALPILSLYNGEKGPGGPKYLFYGIYPVHMLVFGLLTL